MNNRAEKQLGDTLLQMLAADPGPSDSLGKMAHVYSLQRQVYELVMEEVLVREEEPPVPPK